MPERLSDHEIRDITKALEAGKPLDDKYRYLLFKEARQVELVWNGKTNHVTNVALPFQVIEHIDEPRDEVKFELQPSMFDTSGKKIQGWSNKLIWGDNKYVLSSLKSGSIREEIEANGGIKLIYIDPPFDVGADFSTSIEIGDTNFEKAPTVLEEIAFRDTWGMGQDSFLAMIYERLSLMKNLLSPDGIIAVHIDWRLTAEIRLVLDELFGSDLFVNEIIWRYRRWPAPSRSLQKMHDSILVYKASQQNHIFNQEFEELSASSLKQWKGKKRTDNKTDEGTRFSTTGEETSKGALLSDVWEISQITAPFSEYVAYPTQKPEELIGRIIRIFTNKGDLVADFFAGSGTTANIAEKLERKWITSDLGRFSINTVRKRLIKTQRELKEKGNDFRSFEVLSIGSYLFNDSSQQKEFNETVLKAYKAEYVENSVFTGKKLNHYVVVGPLDLPASRDFVDEIIEQCKANKVVEVDLLAFEFGMGVVPDAIDEAKTQGVKLNLKHIPREVFDKKAVADGAVKFSDVGYLEANFKTKKLEIEVELVDFSIFYSQDSLELDGESLTKGKSKVVLDNGAIKKISKSKEGIIKIEDIATSWVDWIEYWAIDYNYEDRQELKIVKHDDGKIEQVATGRNVFENMWQSFKTKSSKIELVSAKYEYPKPGKYRVAVKVIDVFGNDTTRIFDVTVGK